MGRAQLIIATEARNGGKAETKRKENQSGIERERERKRSERSPSAWVALGGEKN